MLSEALGYGPSSIDGGLPRNWLGTLFLYLHVGGVIVAFGPTIAFQLIGARASQEPMHGILSLDGEVQAALEGEPTG